MLNHNRRITKRLSPWDELAGILDDPFDEDAYHREWEMSRPSPRVRWLRRRTARRGGRESR